MPKEYPEFHHLYLPWTFPLFDLYWFLPFYFLDFRLVQQQVSPPLWQEHLWPQLEDLLSL